MKSLRCSPSLGRGGLKECRVFGVGPGRTAGDVEHRVVRPASVPEPCAGASQPSRIDIQGDYRVGAGWDPRRSEYRRICWGVCDHPQSQAQSAYQQGWRESLNR